MTGGITESAAARGGKRNDGLAMEIIGLHKGIDNRWLPLPPDRKANQDQVILRHMFNPRLDRRARALITHFH